MKFNKKTLNNGLRIIIIPMKDNPTVTVLVLVATGSKYETRKLNGISHFLEHMCFKGTFKRPKALDISRALDALGSHYNAFTAQEYTGYYAKSGARHFKELLDIVSDIYLNSSFPETEIEKEKGVIIEEINMYEDMPQRHVQDLFMKLLYGNQPAGWNVAGEKKNILKIKRNDILEYKKAHYLPEATVLIVAGAVRKSEVFREAKKVFGTIKRGQKGQKSSTIERQRKPRVFVQFKATDQTHLVFGVRTHDLFSSQNVALSVIAGILGGGMSSRLFQRLREEMGVGYYIRSYNEAYTDHGFLQVSAGVDNKRVAEVIEVILTECKKLKKYEVPPEELAKVKEHLIGNLKLSLESSDDLANFYGEQEILKRAPKDLSSRVKAIRNVTSRQIKNLAKDIFQNKKLNLALIGPLKSSTELQRVLRF